MFHAPQTGPMWSFNRQLTVWSGQVLTTSAIRGTSPQFETQLVN